MRYNIIINQQKCLELGVNLKEAAILSLFNELSSWADTVVIYDKVYYRINEYDVSEMLPVFMKNDEVEYYLISLVGRGFIDYLDNSINSGYRLSSLGKKYNEL